MAVHQNSEGELLEFCQKNKHELPRYYTTKVKGNIPEFISTVYVTGNQYSSETFPNKKDAEMDAATKALKSLLLDVKLPEKVVLKSDCKTLIIFDVENTLDLFKQFISSYTLTSKVRVDGFISAHHHMLDKLVELTDDMYNVNLMTPRVIMNDAIDYYITMMIGAATSSKEFHRYILVTRDKFGQILRTLLEGRLELITNLDELEKEINGQN